MRLFPTPPGPAARKPKPEKIGRRLYEVTHANGRTRSYFCDIDMNGRQRRVKLQARNRTEARQAQAGTSREARCGSPGGPDANYRR